MASLRERACARVNELDVVDRHCEHLFNADGLVVRWLADGPACAPAYAIEKRTKP